MVEGLSQHRQGLRPAARREQGARKRRRQAHKQPARSKNDDERRKPMRPKTVKAEIRDKSAAAPPSPIPNLAVKRCSAEGTASSRGWETRPSRVSLFWGILTRRRERLRVF